MSNSWSNTSISELTIPTGATTGQRIEINVGQSGDIETFRSDGTLGTKIGGPDGAVISYPTGHTLAAALIDGGLSLGTADGFAGAARVTGELFFGGSLALSTGTGDSTHLDGARALLTAGEDSSVTGSATAPNMLLTDQDVSSACDFYLSGSVIKTGVDGTPDTWQPVTTYGTSWSAATLFGGLGGDALSYRLMPDDTLWLQGLAKTGAGASTTVLTLPAGYRPASGTPHGSVARQSSGAIVTPQEIAITTAGLVIISLGPANGDVYSFNFRIPLHNVA